jgi:hypothetical protein
MLHIRRSMRLGAAVVGMLSIGACAGTGGLGSILGSVLGGAGGGGNGQSSVSGFVNGVDTRNRQIGIQQQNGQTVAVGYDQNTQVVYQNQSYPVTSLENGDQVTLRIQQSQNGGYYTDLVQVDQSVRNSSGGSVYQSGNVQQFDGNVRGVNRQQGTFTVTGQNGAVMTVQIPNQLNQNDLNRFNSLRSGDYVRFYGVYRNNNYVELRQFQ